MNVYKNIRGTDLVVFVLILFPQMSNILLLKSVPLPQPQISNEIMCPYYPYVVLYITPGRYLVYLVSTILMFIFSNSELNLTI